MQERKTFHVRYCTYVKVGQNVHIEKLRRFLSEMHY